MDRISSFLKAFEGIEADGGLVNGHSINGGALRFNSVLELIKYAESAGGSAKAVIRSRYTVHVHTPLTKYNPDTLLNTKVVRLFDEFAVDYLMSHAQDTNVKLFQPPTDSDDANFALTGKYVEFWHDKMEIYYEVDRASESHRGKEVVLVVALPAEECAKQRFEKFSGKFEFE